ncbi:MAG TPA: hypothetical protein VI814_11530 [Candidatus Limnocylindria bacterium]
MLVDEREQRPSILRQHQFQQASRASARPELVWTEDFSAQATRSQASAAAVEDEIAARRTQGLAELAAELERRRTELAALIERQRADALERIATEERLEREAMARRREALDRGTEDATKGFERLIAERIDAAIADERTKLDGRRAALEAAMRDDIEARRRTEVAELDAWRAAERERIATELAAEEQRFNDRLLHQLQEFERQLAERLRESEERLARGSADVEAVVSERLAQAFTTPS